MHRDGPALLREAGHVDDAGALAFEMRRHAEDRADRHHAGAANAGDDHGIRPLDSGEHRLRETGEDGLVGRRLVRRFLTLAAMHRNEARAETLQAGEILVARVLVDGALAAELGLDRLDRDAV